MNSFSVIEVNDAKWSEIIKRSFKYDFYHTQSYNLLETEHRPILCVSYFNDEFIALPLVVRKIPESDLFDCTSVYGYCGPISSVDFNNVSNDGIINFTDQLNDYFKKNNIVTVFSRLHPLIEGESVLNNLGNIYDINSTVAVDLRISPDEQRKQYRKSNKSELNQLRRKDFVIEEARSEKEIDEFISIYNETMDRVNASPNYYFNRNYYLSFLNNKCFKSKLLLAKKGGEIAAGAIFTISDKIMQYHLAGTKSEFIRYTPMKLVLDEARLLANDLNLEFLHLGGGVGGSDEDSLFRFKSGFSQLRFNFKVWKYVVDEDNYNKLVEIKFSSEVPETDFFPIYRLNS
ncbi:GNAT family N-acetyltransferase [Flavobacterium alkalisoli]|uniref:GNAT family N-acetyltransferase n=1 Tax=Flavobacterium alkalisoli TaxID=2602769 RepID=A0A5B9FTS2_9FLAO|nr:GNAT family N-acetyltransferase [Flavobacterium alkalisoli]QEE49466.1 GNAT family N-acetyltransferase [Flavobacterium alkalisoli]